jgi:hypothetical protein
MVGNFRKAKQILDTNVTGRSVVAVNGCCYGKTRVADQGDYLKLYGQEFWEFISGNSNLYIDIIKPLGHRAKERNEAFQAEYAKVITCFTGELIADFCTPDGAIFLGNSFQTEFRPRLISRSKSRITRRHPSPGYQLA